MEAKRTENEPGVYQHANGGVIVAIDAVQARVCIREGLKYISTVEAWKKSQKAAEAEIVSSTAKKPEGSDKK